MLPDDIFKTHCVFQLFRPRYIMQLEIGGGNVTCVQQQMVFGFEQLLLTDLCVINYYIFVNSKFSKTQPLCNSNTKKS